MIELILIHRAIRSLRPGCEYSLDGSVYDPAKIFFTKLDGSVPTVEEVDNALINVRTLDVKSKKNSSISKWRNTHCENNVTYDIYTFQCDQASKINFLFAAQKGEPVDWITADNEIVNLHSLDLNTIVEEFTNRDNDYFIQARKKKNYILSYPVDPKNLDQDLQTIIDMDIDSIPIE